MRLLCYDTGTKVSGFALDSTGKEKIMQKFEKGFFVGAATAAHQVEGNNIHSDYWAQEQLPHTSFAEPSGIACDHYNRYEEDIRLLADPLMQPSIYFFNGICRASSTSTPYTKAAISRCAQPS